MTTPQMQADGVCLKYPNDLGLHGNVSLEAGLTMLTRGMQMATTAPFHWGYIDQPKDGQVFLIFLPNHTPFPNDGIRYMETENKFAMPTPNGREMEVHEIKHGFIPNSNDANAWRMRRRFRLIKGGNPSLVLVHYTRGPASNIIPSLMSQPVRTYPLRPVQEAGVFVAGEKTGHKIPAAGPPAPMGMGGPMPMSGNMAMGMGGGIGGGNIHQQQAMLAQQNHNMEMLERKRAMTAPRAGTQGAPPRVEELEELEDADTISSRALAMARYRRNHDFMNDVFRHAAYRGKFTPVSPTPYADFDLKELEEKTQKLDAEIEALKTKSRQRRERPDVSMSMDVSMSV